MLMLHEAGDNVVDHNHNANNSAIVRSRGAYQQSQKAAEKPEDTDAVVLMMAADKLFDAKKAPDEAVFEETLLYNQAIWTVIQSEMTDDHPLPVEIKSNIISLSLFVDKQTARAIGTRNPESLDPLININRNIAAGLMSR